MNDTGYNEIADLALRKTGQVFDANHRYLVESRLSSILRRENFSTLAELSQCLVARPNPAFELEIAAALTAKDTRFFRDRKTLGHVVSFLQSRVSKITENAPKMRILCAGGGTGQEAYSLAITALENAPELMEARSIEIVSVDVCKASTLCARAGNYSHYEIQTGLSVQRMLKYFTRSDNSWLANEALRKHVNFSVCNLIDGVSALGSFDVVLCRNVLQNLAHPIAIDVASKLSEALEPWGQLILDEAESLPNDVSGLAA